MAREKSKKDIVQQSSRIRQRLGAEYNRLRMNDNSPDGVKRQEQLLSRIARVGGTEKRYLDNIENSRTFNVYKSVADDFQKNADRYKAIAARGVKGNGSEDNQRYAELRQKSYEQDARDFRKAMNTRKYSQDDYMGRNGLSVNSAAVQAKGNVGG